MTETLCSQERQEWLREVSRLTAPWRHAKAAHIERMHPTSAWHLDRAKGLRGRAERSLHCGVDGLNKNCAMCGVVASNTIRLTCSHWRLCQPCKARRADTQIARFHAGRELALARMSQRMKAWTRGGRWDECFYTFPLPHISLESDALELPQAWNRFRRLLAHYLVSRESPSKGIAFFKSVELTSSTGGHWHMHVWSILPYIPQWVLSHLWGSSLSASYQERLRKRPVSDLGTVTGRDADTLAWLNTSELLSPVVDIRRADEAAGELVKYMVKDMERGHMVNPLWYAKAYEALEGMRSHESSRKWLLKRPPVGGWHPMLGERTTKPLCECGSCLPNSKRAPRHFLDPLSTTKAAA